MSDGLQGLATLLLITAVVVGTLAFVHDATRQRIQANRHAALWSAAESMTGLRDLRERGAPPAPGESLELADGRRLCIVDTAGYGGTIRLMVLLDRRSGVLGARVLEHRETPGIGDFIAGGDSAWMAQFRGRDAQDIPGVDGRTGATITANAVWRGVHQLVVAAAEKP